MNSEQTRDPLEQLTTTGEVFGFLYAQEGSEVLRQALAILAKDGSTREQMQLAAAELKAADVNKAAALVEEAASRCAP
jgi:hypothetical protein